MLVSQTLFPRHYQKGADSDPNHLWALTAQRCITELVPAHPNQLLHPDGEPAGKAVGKLRLETVGIWDPECAQLALQQQEPPLRGYQQLSPAPDLWSYSFQSCKEKEIGSRAGCCNFLQNNFLHFSTLLGSGMLRCLALYLAGVLHFHVHLNAGSSSWSSLLELSTLPCSGVSLGFLSGCILLSTRALQGCYLAQGGRKGASRSIYLKAGLLGQQDQLYKALGVG